MDPEVLELLEHLFRFRYDLRGGGAGGTPCVMEGVAEGAWAVDSSEPRASHLRVPPWQIGEVLLRAAGCRAQRSDGSHSVDRGADGHGRQGFAPDSEELAQAARIECAWAVRILAALRLSASSGARSLALLERGVPVSPETLAGRLAERLGLERLPASALGTGSDPRAAARRTLELAELALELAPSDAARITLALAASRAGEPGRALACLRSVLSPAGGVPPEACDAAAAWWDAGVLLAEAGRPGPASRLAARSRALDSIPDRVADWSADRVSDTERVPV